MRAKQHTASSAFEDRITKKQVDTYFYHTSSGTPDVKVAPLTAEVRDKSL